MLFVQSRVLKCMKPFFLLQKVRCAISVSFLCFRSFLYIIHFVTYSVNTARRLLSQLIRIDLLPLQFSPRGDSRGSYSSLIHLRSRKLPNDRRWLPLMEMPSSRNPYRRSSILIPQFQFPHTILSPTLLSGRIILKYGLPLLDRLVKKKRGKIRPAKTFENRAFPPDGVLLLLYSSSAVWTICP